MDAYTHDAALVTAPAPGRGFVAFGDELGRIVLVGQDSQALAWAVELGDGPGPAEVPVAVGRIRQGKQDVVLAMAKDTLYGLDRESGEKRWSELFPGGRARLLPQAGAGRFLVAAGDSGVDTVKALSPNGIVLMEERPGGATLAWDEGDAVALYGLEGRTPSGRAERWTVSVPDGEESAARTLPAGTVSAATEVDKHLHVHTRRGVACEPLTAEGERWEFAADGDSVNVDQEPPTVVEDRVVFRYGEALYAVSRKYGGRLWKFVADGQITGRLSTAPRAGEEGSLLLFGTDQGTLYAVDSRSGKQVWRHAMPGDPVHGPVLDGDLLYAAQGRTLYALDVAGPRRG